MNLPLLVLTSVRSKFTIKPTGIVSFLLFANNCFAHCCQLVRNYWCKISISTLIVIAPFRGLFHRNELEEFCLGLSHYNLLDLVTTYASSFHRVFVFGANQDEDVSAEYIIATFLL